MYISLEPPTLTCWSSIRVRLIYMRAPKFPFSPRVASFSPASSPFPFQYSHAVLPFLDRPLACPLPLLVLLASVLSRTNARGLISRFNLFGPASRIPRCDAMRDVRSQVMIGIPFLALSGDVPIPSSGLLLGLFTPRHTNQESEPSQGEAWTKRRGVIGAGRTEDAAESRQGCVGEEEETAVLPRRT